MNEPPHQQGQSWPPPAYGAPQALVSYDRDADHLKLLSIFYYIWGALSILGGCFFIFYIIMGSSMAAMTSSPQFRSGPNQLPMPPVAHVITIVGVVGLTLGWVFGALALYAGYCMGRMTNATLIMVVAGLSCLSIPLGTVLGVFTFIVLSRPSVKSLFR